MRHGRASIDSSNSRTASYDGQKEDSHDRIVYRFPRRLWSLFDLNCCSGGLFVRLNTRTKDRHIILAGVRNYKKCENNEFDYGASGNVLIRLLSK